MKRIDTMIAILQSKRNRLVNGCMFDEVVDIDKRVEFLEKVNETFEEIFGLDRVHKTADQKEYFVAEDVLSAIRERFGD